MGKCWSKYLYSCEKFAGVSRPSCLKHSFNLRNGGFFETRKLGCCWDEFSTVGRQRLVIVIDVTDDWLEDTTLGGPLLSFSIPPSFFFFPYKLTKDRRFPKEYVKLLDNFNSVRPQGHNLREEILGVECGVAVFWNTYFRIAFRQIHCQWAD